MSQECKPLHLITAIEACNSTFDVLWAMDITDDICLCDLRHPCEAWKGAKHSPEDSAGNHKILMILTCHMAQKAIPAHYDGFKQWLSSKIILVHISMMLCSKQLWIRVLFIITKIKKYDIWICRTTCRDLWMLLILSEFNVQYINRSVGEFYTLLIILRMWIKKVHHERNEENWFQESWFLKIIIIKCWKRLYACNLTRRTMRLLPGASSIYFIKIPHFCQNAVSEIQWYLNHISSSDGNEEVKSKRNTSLDIFIILNSFLTDSVNDKS